MALRFNIRQFALWLVLLQVALGVRLAAANAWQQRTTAAGKTFAFGDSEGYWELARAIAAGRPYQYQEYRVFRTPGYPLLLAPLFWLSGEREPSVLWARYLGALCGTLAVGLAAWLAWKLFDERAAWIAGLIATFYPAQIATSVFVLSEAPFLPLLLGQLGLAITALEAWPASRRRAFAWAASAGLVCGGAVLVRPSWLLFVPFAICLALAFSGQRRRNICLLAVMLLSLAATLTPWWVRNYFVSGRFVLTTSQVGISLADGLNPHANGGSDYRWLDEIVVSEQAMYIAYMHSNEHGSFLLHVMVSPEFEWALDRRMKVEAIDWAKQNPARALQLAGIKFLRMWNIVPNASEFGSARFRLLYAATYGPLLAACIWGLWKYRGGGWRIWLLLLPAVYFTLLHMVFVASIRYQQPALAAWLILAAGALCRAKLRPC